MNYQDEFEKRLTAEQRAIFAELDTPAKIQAFLDATPYSPENANRCPLSVLRDRTAHCLDGALFAAAALRRIGYPPVLIDLLPDPGADDDHILAIYKVDGHYGSLAKSNYTGLRSREPIHRSLRELVLTYFEDFISLYQERTLRRYTVPLRLETYDDLGWMWSDAGADAVERLLGKLRKIPLITPEMAARLPLVDDLSNRAATLVTNIAGVYVPKKRPGEK